MTRLPSPSGNIEAFVARNHLIYTDLRFSIGNDGGVSDVIDIIHSGDTESRRRLLLIDEGVADISAEVWDVAKDSERHYLIPEETADYDTDGVRVYELPISVRPLKHDYRGEQRAPKNFMGNERIADSAGFLLGEYYGRTGHLLGVETLQEQIAIVDFVDEDEEPVLFMPPISAAEDSVDPHVVYKPASVNESQRVVDVFLESFRLGAEHD